MQEVTTLIERAKIRAKMVRLTARTRHLAIFEFTFLLLFSSSLPWIEFDHITFGMRYRHRQASVRVPHRRSRLTTVGNMQLQM